MTANNNVKIQTKGKHKYEFGEGPIFTITNYIIWLFLGNLYFFILNLPLLYAIIVIISSGSNRFPEGFGTIFALCCIPIGPAATALFSVMGKLVREKEVNITKDFFKAYKTNFLQSIFLGSMGILIIILILFDIKIIILYRYPSFIITILYAVIIFIAILGLYAFPLISRFYLKSKDVLKLSVYYAVIKIHITILNVCSFVIVGFIFLKTTSFIVLFISSIICYLIMFYEKNIIIEMEEKSKKHI